MKKVLFGLIATVILSMGSYAQTVPVPVPKSDPALIEITFGRKSMKCTGFGICEFKVHLTADDLVTLITAIGRPDGSIKITMSSDFYKRNASSFQNGYLVLEENYVLDSETARAIGVADKYTIKTGKYPVVFDKAANTYNCTF